MAKNKRIESPTAERSVTTQPIKWKSFLAPTIVAVLLRWVIFAYFHDYLEDNVAFVAPWNSFRRLKDALTLWRNGVSLYAGGYHSTPWAAFMFAPLLDYDFVLLAIFTAFDLFAAYFTFRFTVEFLKDKTDTPVGHAMIAYNIYILNPLGVGICAVFSLSSFVNLLLAAALYFNHKRQVYLTVLLVSLIAQFNIYYVVLLFAINYQKKDEENADQSTCKCLIGLLVAIGLYASNGLLANLGDFFNENVMFFFRVDDYTPNVGNFWYMFTQVFPHYRLFFLFVFQILSFVYAYPLWRILKEHPMTLWFVFLQLVAIGSSYPTYAELCAYLPLFFTFNMYHKYYRLTYLITIALVISIATATITLTQWVQSGSGNANFYFGSCTTYMLALIGLAYETVNAHLINQDVQWSGLKDPNTHRFYVNVPAERLQKAQ
ncbi:Phosphatidylinositol glycan anchor biosynthesis class U protein [Aphelenchoides bicaudatus]|nr:Phosphatidylinositol glycan anchor biosynthesis class U protein [Aphelenchoides bicaudatus]